MSFRSRTPHDQAGHRRFWTAKAGGRTVNARAQRAKVDMRHAPVGDVEPFLTFSRSLDEPANFRFKSFLEFGHVIDHRFHCPVLEFRSHIGRASVRARVWLAVVMSGGGGSKTK